MIFFLVSHTLGSKGAFDYFSDYLRSAHHELICVFHPLDVYKNKVTSLLIHEKLVSRISRRNMFLLNFIQDMYLTLTYISTNTFDIYIGANNFDTLAGVIGKYCFHRSYKIIYFASDYSENRFDNWVLDAIYMFVERLVLKFSDVVISNTYRAERKRLELGLTKNKSFVVPNCAPIKHEVFHHKRIEKSSYVYVGNITAGSGLVAILTLLKPVIRRLIIIGDSPDWLGVKRAVHKIGIRATFYRHKSHEFVISYLQKFEGFGLAPYDDKNHWTYYGSSLKMYDYIVSGVPVITSSRTEMSLEIKKKSLGIVYDILSFDDLKKRIDEYQTDMFYMKARSFYKKYNMHALYGPIISTL